MEVAFARDDPTPLPVNPDDLFVATTWWTAHHAHNALAETNSERFLYLIQEYEPFTFVMGSWAAIARQTYDFPHFGLFSTSFLRDWFAARGEGVYAAGRERGDLDSVDFQNAITAVEPPSLGELRSRETRRLLFYARAEPHAKRNLFELGLIALVRGDRARDLRTGVGVLRGRLGRGPQPDRAAARDASRRARAPRTGRLRAHARRARRRPLADVHAASQPRTDRDGCGRDAHRHQHASRPRRPPPWRPYPPT